MYGQCVAPHIAVHGHVQRVRAHVPFLPSSLLPALSNPGAHASGRACSCMNARRQTQRAAVAMLRPARSSGWPGSSCGGSPARACAMQVRLKQV